MGLITPAILPNSSQELEEQLSRFAMVPQVRRVQLDVVDGKFASPASWPYTELDAFQKMRAAGKSLPHVPRFEYEIDLMVQEPEIVALDFIALGATRIIIHAESTTRLPRVLALLRQEGGFEKDFLPQMISVGFALNIATDLSLLEAYTSKIDFVQFMGIAHIGQQGQPFDKRVLQKIRTFKEKHPAMPVQVDGGVTLSSARELLASGVATLVVGHDLKDARDVSAEIARFEALTPQYGV